MRAGNARPPTPGRLLSRRDLAALAGSALLGVGAVACGTSAARDERPPATELHRQGRLTARPQSDVEATGEPGLREIGNSFVLVPRADAPHGLVLMLHGAGGSARDALAPLRDLAEEANVILVAPQSEGSTWDVIVGGYGTDVSAIDALLTDVFDEREVDPERVAVGGFSDGASYALSLGLTNGDLFRTILAFSPGFSVVLERHGKPRVYVSHGTDDAVLPTDATSRRLVPQLRRSGYDVRYHEFRGGHTVPPEVAREALEWFAGDA